jgi:hypothetical protein
MLKFLIPFQFLFYSRLKRKNEVFSVIYIYPLYLFIFIFLFYGGELYPNVVLFPLLLTAWMFIYELGYLENDAITIKNETNPNLRISFQDIGLIQANFSMITLIRVACFGAIMSIIFFSKLLPINGLIFFMIFILLVRGVFYLHNTIRSRHNILTYLILCSAKYFILPLIFLKWDYGAVPYLIIFFSFPLLRTIEHAVKEKYQLFELQQWIGSLDRFRFLYYGFSLGLFLIFYFSFTISIIWVFSIAYFFVFRMGIFLLIRSGKQLREI